MDEDRNRRAEGFLARWSRVKTGAREPAQEPVAPAPAAPREAARDEPPQLPKLDELTFDSEFKDFFHPKVDEDVRRGALRKLFSAPQFNVMDGLDVYIDDYSQTEPIPAAMLASLTQAQRILGWAAEKDEGREQKAAPETLAAAEPPEVAPPVPAPGAPPEQASSAATADMPPPDPVRQDRS